VHGQRPHPDRSTEELSSAPDSSKLGAGDGTLSLNWRNGLSRPGQEAELLLLDRYALLNPPALHRFSKFRCRAVAEQADVRDWLS
jgi:hypothetical protein